MSGKQPDIGVIGGGAWGTALAQAYAHEGRRVLLWAREADVITAINDRHENTPFLPDVPLNKNITATDNLGDAAAAPVILLVSPAQHVRGTMAALKDHIHHDEKPVVICAKGIELSTGKLLTTAAHEAAPNLNTAILTGPTFAAEIARGLPSAVTVAVRDAVTGENLRAALACRTLRPYIGDDLTGAQIGGAVKNVIAIACGILVGKGLGESARAALMTRGLAEMARLAVALGAKRETIMGLSGAGDLMLTASSMQSRNFSLGFQMGQGRSATDILGERRAVTEGVHTARAVMELAAQQGIDMPISQAVNACLNDNVDIDDAIATLLDRPLKAEVL